MFTLTAQILGQKHTTSAERDETGAIVVHTSSGTVAARTVSEAVRIAHRDMGEYLVPAQRPGRRWGLLVQVAEVQASYGEWPGFPAPPSGKPDNSLVTRIRRGWHDSGPISALDNALEIIKAYLGPASRHIAA